MYCHFSNISRDWLDTVIWNPSSWKTMIQLANITNGVAAENLVMEERGKAITGQDIERNLLKYCCYSTITKEKKNKKKQWITWLDCGEWNLVFASNLYDKPVADVWLLQLSKCQSFCLKYIFWNLKQNRRLRSIKPKIKTGSLQCSS